jgi:endonuclease-3
MLNVDSNTLINELEQLFPDAKCELTYRNIYELSVAVILSAQTSDVSVNKVTPFLFTTYPTINDLANAKYENVFDIISPLGLAKRKAEYIIKFAKTVLDKYQGIVPNTIEELITIPGIGRKTANVIISEGYGLPGLAVDVHVTRVSKRLGLASETATPDKIEVILKNYIPKELWHNMHHKLIFMGRYLCKSQKPDCYRCPFTKNCLYYNAK